MRRARCCSPNEPEIGKAGALSVVALDQIAGRVVKVAVIGCAASLIGLPQWMERGLAGLGLAVAVMFVGAIVIAARTRHFGALREPSRFLRGIAFAACVKAAEACAILAVQRGFGLGVSVQSVMVVLAASALGSVVPIARRTSERTRLRATARIDFSASMRRRRWGLPSFSTCVGFCRRWERATCYCPCRSSALAILP